MKILIAWYYFLTNRNNALAQKRLKICSECERRIWFVCGVCGCPLNAKARLPDEPCEHPDGNKWI